LRGRSKRAGVLHRLARDERANTAIIFAYALLPIAMMAGAAVDLRQSYNSRAYLQDSADAAVLAAAKAYYGATGKTAAERLQIAQTAAGSYMSQAVDRRAKAVQSPEWSLTLDTTKGEFVFRADAKAPAAFGGLFGIDAVDIGVESAALSGDRRVEVALVLDSTGSMAGSKMTELKKAATNFVNTMESAAANHPKNDAVKIALVPYNATVRIGAKYDTAKWMDLEGRSSIHYENLSLVRPGESLPDASRIQRGVELPTRFTLLKRMGGWGGCVESRPAPYDAETTAPDPSKPDTLYVPYFYPDEPDARTSTNGAPSGERINSYLPDGVPPDANGDWFKRQQNYTKYLAAPTFGAGKGPNVGCFVAPVVRLTDRFSDVRSGVKAMQPDGFTNVFMGLTWGWNAVADQAPFADGAGADEDDVTKIIILMTDGLNTYRYANNPNRSDYNALGFITKKRIGIGDGSEAQRQKAMDARLAKLCEEVKAKKAVLYTIRVEVNDGDTKLMKACASTPDHFHDVRDAAQLTQVFDDIARQILQIRLSR
jgi:Flp pilus assembly protein TadG